jgi:hypothetical protein
VERVPAIKVLLLPKDTNPLGTIFGGVILSHVDLASAVEARKTGRRRWVTKAMREVEFHEPVYLGDIVNFFTETVRGPHLDHGEGPVEAERWRWLRRAREGHGGRGRPRLGRRVRAARADPARDRGPGDRMSAPARCRPPPAQGRARTTVRTPA